MFLPALAVIKRHAIKQNVVGHTCTRRGRRISRRKHQGDVVRDCSTVQKHHRAPNSILNTTKKQQTKTLYTIKAAKPSLYKYHASTDKRKTQLSDYKLFLKLHKDRGVSNVRVDNDKKVYNVDS